MKFVQKLEHTHFIFNNFIFDNLTVYEIMWRNTAERGRTHITIWCKHNACWIPKAINTHISCVIIVAFSLQKCLHERASILRYTYIGCAVEI